LLDLSESPPKRRARHAEREVIHDRIPPLTRSGVSMIRVLIADDHAVVRHGLKQIMASHAHISIVAEAESGAQALEQVRAVPLDVVILDITMENGNGIETLKQIRIEFPELPVLILSMHPEREYGLRSIRAGASGYLSKSSAPDELLVAIERLALHRKYISVALAEQLAGDYGSTNDAPHERLSPREYEVFGMLVAGRSVTEIANELALSVKTISTHRSRLLEKLGVRNTAELMRYAATRNLL
jgi:two-component system invasion response regulator UvrY